MRRALAWIVLAIVVLIGFRLLSRPVEPDAQQRYEESKPQNEAVRRQIAAKAETVYVASVAHSNQSLATANHALAEREHAATEAKLAAAAQTAQDSAAHWRAAYVAERTANDSLTDALATEREAAAEARRSALFWKEANDSTTARLRVSEAVTNAVVAANRCRVLPGVPCPSRTVSGLLGFGAGLAARSLLPH